MTQDERSRQCTNWVAQHLKAKVKLIPIPGDASFRRYFRCYQQDKTWIVMDAPPSQENVHIFVAIARAFSRIGLCVPEIIAADETRGFVLMSDFGDQILLKILNAKNVDGFYHQAWQALLKLQTNKIEIIDYVIPDYTPALYQAELDLFKDWYLGRHLKYNLTDAEKVIWEKISRQLITTARAQPQVLVHRDYHSRNLMVLENGGLGILDFQDALWGPITYDLVSLLEDCCIDWPEAQVRQWMQQYLQASQAQGVLLNVEFDKFCHWFDLLGLQRHLKCLGIFARLNYRDQKSNYLKYLPRILNYVLSIVKRYPEFNLLAKLVTVEKI